MKGILLKFEGACVPPNCHLLTCCVLNNIHIVSLRPAELGYHKQAVARIAQAEEEAPRTLCKTRVLGVPSDAASAAAAAPLPPGAPGEGISLKFLRI